MKLLLIGRKTLIEKIADFLSLKIIGKTLVTDELKYTLDDGKLEGSYSDNMIFSNLAKSMFGLSFDLFVISKERVYKLADKKQRAGLVSELSGIGVFRYELAYRKSTDMVTGTLRLITTTVKNQTSQAIVSGVFDLTLNNEELHWREQQLLYRDQVSQDGKYHPVAFDAKNRLYFENGKARFEYDGACYDVEPASVSRRPSKDAYPKFIAKES